MIDQTRLPYKFTYVSLRDYLQVAKAIKEMTVRGTSNRRRRGHGARPRRQREQNKK